MTIKNKVNYAIGASSSKNKTQAALNAETQRNILLINANERIADKDAKMTLERDEFKAKVIVSVIIAIVIGLIIYLIIKQ